ncbi:dihydrofolate reductase [Lusitaniella coriacea LEGE 07157]|uniref:Dihydrofolate reductase n=1 Tax=Lusitaniella coriacea LEGE 07157 TaxID=945747 RepID=A0A8J7AP96_9CYAN|nr:dihydrofolate reductase family protein [Lusitaniella coriacea]MBE9115428.1 dihydrofolate reductase [Lusitaniella coriacea LEGE 07157]
MSIRLSVFIATSLDGFIARKNGELDWLDAANAIVPEGEDCGYRAFMESIDRLIMGRKTYEKVLSFDEWSYGNKPVIVLSRNKIEIPDRLAETVSHSSESPRDLRDRLSKEGAERLYIDGGITIQRFLNEGLIDDLTITIIPILLGSGIPLFSNLKKDISLNHIATKTYDFGFIQLTYEVVNNAKKH